MSKGKVYIVGAGPGDASLLTLKAAELLGKAQVVIYDRLVDPGVLKLINRDARRINSGKKVGARGIQDTINATMVEEAKKGNVVVRLKGGDPMLFGRGGEEAEFLMHNNVDYEIVPGVTSAFAAPAYAGIPLTHRGFSSSVLIVTGHRAEQKGDQGLDWKAMAGAADTLVILMGAATFPRHAQELIDGGLSEDTPVAIIQWAATKNQKTRLFRLGTIAVTKRPGLVEPPSVIVVGAVASLSKKLDWFKVGGRTRLENLYDVTRTRTR